MKVTTDGRGNLYLTEDAGGKKYTLAYWRRNHMHQWYRRMSIATSGIGLNQAVVPRNWFIAVEPKDPLS